MTEHCDVTICKSVESQITYISYCTVLETGAGHDSEPCDRFDDLREIIDLVYEPRRIGVCFDTCHVFAAGDVDCWWKQSKQKYLGYPLHNDTDYDRTMFNFDRIVGFEQIRAFHLNDSRG